MNRTYAASCWFLSALFGARVAGQAVQRWAAQPFLPPFEAWQGSRLPYGALLASQLVILGVMLYLSWRIQEARLAPSRRAGRVLVWLGGAYMAVALARIAIGLVLPEAPVWFRSWISGAFHVVLAGFVLVVAAYHLRSPALSPEAH